MDVLMRKVGLLLLFLVTFVVLEAALSWQSHPRKLVLGKYLKVLMDHPLKLVMVLLGCYDESVGSCWLYYFLWHVGVCAVFGRVVLGPLGWLKFVDLL